MNKSEYIHALLRGRIYNGMLMQGALVYWHSKVPFTDALMYITNLEKKLNESYDPRNHD